MTTATQQRKQSAAQPAHQPAAAIEPIPPHLREVEFQPFGSSEPIRLSVSIVQRFVSAKTKKGHVASDLDCMKFLALCKARSLNPFEGDAYLVGYDSDDGPTFSLITAHQAFLKRAEAHPQHDGMDSGVMVQTKDGEIIDREGDFYFPDETLVGAWATVYRKDRSHPTKRRLALRTFNTDRSRWKKDPGGMIVKCAEADALRSTYPNSLAGMFLEQEIITPQTTAEKMLGKLPESLPRAKTIQHAENPSQEIEAAPAAKATQADAAAPATDEQKDAIRKLITTAEVDVPFLDDWYRDNGISPEALTVDGAERLKVMLEGLQ